MGLCNSCKRDPNTIDSNLENPKLHKHITTESTEILEKLSTKHSQFKERITWLEKKDKNVYELVEDAISNKNRDNAYLYINQRKMIEEFQDNHNKKLQFIAEQIELMETASEGYLENLSDENYKIIYDKNYDDSIYVIEELAKQLEAESVKIEKKLGYRSVQPIGILQDDEFKEEIEEEYERIAKKINNKINKSGSVDIDKDLDINIVNNENNDDQKDDQTH